MCCSALKELVVCAPSGPCDLRNFTIFNRLMGISSATTFHLILSSLTSLNHTLPFQRIEMLYRPNFNHRLSTSASSSRGTRRTQDVVLTNFSPSSTTPTPPQVQGPRGIGLCVQLALRPTTPRPSTRPRPPTRRRRVPG